MTREHTRDQRARDVARCSLHTDMHLKMRGKKKMMPHHSLGSEGCD